MIAHENMIEGWWEAIVIATDNDMLTLRWRDYPKQENAPRLSGRTDQARCSSLDVLFMARATEMARASTSTCSMSMRLARGE